MKMFKSEEYIKMANPTPGKPYRPEILTKDHQAKNLGGMFGLLVAGSQVPYHYHNNRESIIIVISGEATEVVESEEIPIKAGDVLFIPAGEKHATINSFNQDFRYLEFFTCPPLTADFVEAK
ncbi:MAG TPA: cupin domain-containing protein [Thermodesulfobacteriota bacterium]|nr:cupin domain-containing protein [Thermodesulfobacteriota bacterium]